MKREKSKECHSSLWKPPSGRRERKGQKTKALKYAQVSGSFAPQKTLSLQKRKVYDS